MIKADTPNLWEIRENLGIVKTKALIIYALACVAELVNIERNLNEPQMMELADDILTDYGYYKLEEVKYILKRAISSEKLFARLDYNIVMGWFKAYDVERTEHCIDISDQEETEKANRVEISDNAMSYEQYIAYLQEKADNGDKDAAGRLEELTGFQSELTALLTPEQQRQKEIEFKKYFFTEYLKGKNYGRQNKSTRD